jgi:hypothetical protein
MNVQKSVRRLDSSSHLLRVACRFSGEQGKLRMDFITVQLKSGAKYKHDSSLNIICVSISDFNSKNINTLKISGFPEALIES